MKNGIEIADRPKSPEGGFFNFKAKKSCCAEDQLLVNFPQTILPGLCWLRSPWNNLHSIKPYVNAPAKISWVMTAPSASPVPRSLVNKFLPATDTVGTYIMSCWIVVMVVVGLILNHIKLS